MAAADAGTVYATSRQLARENTALRTKLSEWEVLAAQHLRPFIDRTGQLALTDLHDGLARLASLALAHGISHAEVMNAVRPDVRGAAVTMSVSTPAGPVGLGVLSKRATSAHLQTP